MAAPSDSNLSAVAKLHTALSKTLPQRCSDITALIESTTAKELHSIFPSFLDSVFGFNNQPGWGLQRITKSSNHSDYHSIRSFLSPLGAMMKLVFKLVSEEYFRYEFPMSCLPYPTRCKFEEGTVPALYMNKLQFHGHGLPSNMLSLDAFEYYMFHLAYFLVNPVFSKGGLMNSPTDLLYFGIIEDYLNHFLPLDSSKPVSDNSILISSVHNSFQHNSPRMSPHPSFNKWGTSPSSRSHMSLLRSQSQCQWKTTPHSPSVTDQKNNQTSRSELVIQVFVEFWLNQSSLDIDTPRVGRHSNNIGGGLFHSSSNLHYTNYCRFLLENFMPSVDHVQVARMIVKHLHYFTNSAREQLVVSPYSQPTIDPMEEFKRNVIPGLVQKKLYSFLKHGFHKWPLDTSFRMMLEMWLSYIQPWRYQDVSQAYQYKEQNERSRHVEEKWNGFIFDNLLFYTGLFQEFLPRLFRLDLSSPKNAYMLYRVTKVFSAPGLVELIYNGESSLLEPHRHRYGQDLGGSYISANTSMSFFHLPLELEGPVYEYRPMFSDDTKMIISQLIQMIKHAKVTAASIQSTNENGSGLLSFLGFGPMVDYNAQRFSSFTSEDSSSADSRRVEIHLEHSAKNLCAIFRLDEAFITDNIQLSSDNSGMKMTSTLPPDHILTDHGPRLTDLGRIQLMNGLRKFEVKYQGDPELHPIRSTESKVLVRMLYHLSSFLNQQFGEKIEQFYNRTDVIGRVSRQLLLPPINNISPVGMKASSPGLPQTDNQRLLIKRPRISLRFLSSFQNLTYVTLCYMFMWYSFGFGPVLFVFFMFALSILYAFLKSLITTTDSGLDQSHIS
ncbi:sphingomyelin phosphodiesterase 4-like [Tubulanus polymorphus]|uniref:sphingomyelin phosphodiesterase 4-like n=1 Tax=Tubulanus polymorphus TaxID=672921 RepID=UPI003DA31C52